MAQNSKTSGSGLGRGWHGDPEGHAKAGRQSHKNDGARKNPSAGELNDFLSDDSSGSR